MEKQKTDNEEYSPWLKFTLRQMIVHEIEQALWEGKKKKAKKLRKFNKYLQKK